MKKQERWNLGNFSSKTKEAIKKKAKEKGMFVNDYVEEILDKYLADEEFERHKNFFDQRWKEVIDTIEFFSEGQQKEREMWIQALQAVEEVLENFSYRLLSLETETVIDQELLKKILRGEILKEPAPFRDKKS